MSRINWSKALWATLAIAALAPLNMGGCATDAVSGAGKIGSITGKGSPLPAGSEQYVAAGEKAAQTMALDERDEDSMGQSVAIAVTGQYGLVNDPALTKYVTLVGLTVAAATDRPDGNYVFGVVNSTEVNAFAGPNGYILITRGALAQMRDEAELAGVLAHEISHVIHHDGMNAVKQSGMIDAAGTFAKTADGRIAMVSQWTDGVVDVVLKKGYSKDQELSADVSAVLLVKAAGYDPNSYLHFVERMSSPNAGSPMSTHPGLAQRVTRIKAQIGSSTGGATLQPRFAKNVHK